MSAERILAIGDIHGCDDALTSLLKLIEPQKHDTVVILGDVVDRGPDSRRVIDILMGLAERTTLVPIMGNHDEMLLDCVDVEFEREFWLDAGGRATIDSYGGALSLIPQDHISFLRSFRDYWETETEIFVHASVEPDVPMDEQIFPWLRGSRLTGNERPHVSGKRVICGHTSQPTGWPALLPGFVCIDTWAYGGKWLTCLDVTNNLVYQASQFDDLGGPTPLREIGMHFE